MGSFIIVGTADDVMILCDNIEVNSCHSNQAIDIAAIRNGALGIRSLPSQAKNLDREGRLCVPSAGF